MDRVNNRLVKGFRLLGFRKNPLVPCAGMMAKLDASIEPVMPVLFIRNAGRAAYVPEKGVLTIRHGGRLITLCQDGTVVVGRAWDEEVARRVLEEIVEMVNEAYGELLREGPPSDEELRKAMELDWRRLLDLMPGLDCGECGRRTCQAFSIDVLRGQARLSDCPLVRTDDEIARRIKMALGVRLARALGL